MKTIRIVGLLLAVFLTVVGGTAEVRAQDITSNNLVVLLDASGSMDDKMPDGTKKMDAAKAALKEVLSQVPLSTNIGLLVFPRDGWVYDLGPRDDQRLLSAINGIEAGGNTPLGSNMKLAADKLLAQREQQLGLGTYRLLVISDGEETQNRGLPERYTPEIMSRGVQLDVIGVAMNSDHTLATKVHSYRRADDAQTLTKAIKEVVAEVSGNSQDSSSAETFELIAGLPDGMAPKLIDALSNTGNQPIGEKPPQLVQSDHSSGAPTVAESARNKRVMLIVLAVIVVVALVLTFLLKDI